MNMEKQFKPIKRHSSLQPLSRDHHHTLLLVWKIRKAIKERVSLDRVDQYVSWFYEQYVLPHFDKEEQFIYPILGEEHELIVQAHNEHKQLKGYFEAKGKDEIAYAELADLLDKHIRFEERTLFNLIQGLATEQQMETIAEKHGSDLFADNEADPFWK